MNFAKLYSKFRGSTWFLGLLVGACTFWLTAHWLFGMDKDLGGLNIFLSFEASISLAFFTMVNDSQAEAAKKQTDTMEAILRKLESNDEKMLEIVEDIQEEVDTDGH
jgi:hypothetical protein